MWLLAGKGPDRLWVQLLLQLRRMLAVCVTLLALPVGIIFLPVCFYNQSCQRCHHIFVKAVIFILVGFFLCSTAPGFVSHFDRRHVSRRSLAALQSERRSAYRRYFLPREPQDAHYWLGQALPLPLRPPPAVHRPLQQCAYLNLWSIAPSYFIMHCTSTLHVSLYSYVQYMSYEMLSSVCRTRYTVERGTVQPIAAPFGPHLESQGLWARVQSVSPGGV